MATPESQSLAVKRAQVEFHNFASLGEPGRVFRVYAEENARRGGLIRKHLDFLQPLSPFLEIGANAGHSSYMLANEFGGEGFALDISADSLRHGIALREAMRFEKSPVRIAGDALRLPFRDGSLRLVLAFQMLSQFQDIDAVFREVVRVLAPGGVFLFAEEPLRRMLSLRLYRAPYVEQMTPFEKWLFRSGLLGFVVKDVIGAHQEESFGIRQNHTMRLNDWHALVTQHFAEHRYDVFVPQRGWAERWTRAAGRRIDKHGTDWVPARLLGGTLAAACRKAGKSDVGFAPDRFESVLQCPDCGSPLERDSVQSLSCVSCDYAAANEGGVYNLLRSVDKKELYPGDRPDIIDFSLPGHESKLGSGWHALEGVFGNKYRWMGSRASVSLVPAAPGPQTLRIRGHASEGHVPVELRARANGADLRWEVSRPGLFVVEALLEAADRYEVEIAASPVWKAPGDPRDLSVNIGLIRLIPAR